MFKNKKIPFIHQTNDTDCGPCVVTMILQYYGAMYSLGQVKEILPSNRDGTTVKMLINAFGYYGITANAYYLEENKLIAMREKLPAIVNWNNNHYVIVERICKNYIYIMDPDLGRYRVSYDEFNNRMSGIVILLKCKSFFKKKKETRSIKCILRVMNKQRKLFIFNAILDFLCRGILVITPFFIGESINYFRTGSVVSNKMISAIFFVFIAFILQLVSSWFSNYFKVRFEKNLYAELVYKLLYLPFYKIDDTRQTEFLWILNNLNKAPKILLDITQNLLYDLITIAVIMSLIFSQNWTIGLGIFSILIISFCIMMILSDSLKYWRIRQVKNEEKLTMKNIELLTSIESIKSFNCEKSYYKDWMEINESNYKENLTFNNRVFVANGIYGMIGLLSPLIVLSIGIYKCSCEKYH